MNSNRLVDHFFRHEYGRLVASLTRALGVAHLELVEDVVQSALLQALQSWSHRGVPDDPGGWLFRVARNSALDALRRNKRWEAIVNRLPIPAEDEDLAERIRFDGELSDDQLRMLFVCCREELPVESQVALALKTLCGFGVPEIARALLTTEANIQKRLVRARDRLRDLEWNPDALDAERIRNRLEAVRTVIYLLFNEGYNSSQPDSLIRRDLCEEAIRLGILLCEHPLTNEPASAALLALMFFHTARFDARSDDRGTLFLLEEQDRTLWDQELIGEGLYWLVQSAQGEALSRYHLEAGIVAEHCLCSSFGATNWRRIVELYDRLIERMPNPLNDLNRAVAVSRLHGPEKGLEALEALSPERSLDRYYLWNAVVGELRRQAGHLNEAKLAFEKALVQCPSAIERDLLQKRLNTCEEVS